MLDVLEDYLTARKYPTERIDGQTPARLRQAAIDRFSTGVHGFPPAALRSIQRPGSGWQHDMRIAMWR